MDELPVVTNEQIDQELDNLAKSTLERASQLYQQLVAMQDLLEKGRVPPEQERRVKVTIRTVSRSLATCVDLARLVCVTSDVIRKLEVIYGIE